LNLRTDPDNNAAVSGSLKMQTELKVVDRTRQDETLPNGLKRPIYWFKVEAVDKEGKPVQGWVYQANIFIESRTESPETRGTKGEACNEFSLDDVDRIINSGRFGQSLWYTLLLIVLIVPIQFVFANIMALVIHSQHHGSSNFRYLYTSPLG